MRRNANSKNRTLGSFPSSVRAVNEDDVLKFLESAERASLLSYWLCLDRTLATAGRQYSLG